jgi:hypothetical protein
MRDLTDILNGRFRVLSNGAVIVEDVERIRIDEYYQDQHSFGKNGRELWDIPLTALVSGEIEYNGCIYLEFLADEGDGEKRLLETNITVNKFLEHKKQKKMSYAEMVKKIHEHNEKNNITSQFGDKNPLEFVIVYKASNWKREYSERARSYMVQSDNKMWVDGMCGNSIFGDCLDGSENGVRLDWYNWVVEYCYPVA